MLVSLHILDMCAPPPPQQGLAEAAPRHLATAQSEGGGGGAHIALRSGWRAPLQRSPTHHQSRFAAMQGSRPPELRELLMGHGQGQLHLAAVRENEPV